MPRRLAVALFALATVAAGLATTVHAQATVRPPAFASTLRCGEHEAVVGVEGDTVQLRVAGERFTLRAVRTASGAKYEAPDDAGTYFWSQGRNALVSVRGRRLPACRIATPDDQAALLQGADWVVEDIDRGGIIDRSRVTLHFVLDADGGSQMRNLADGKTDGNADGKTASQASQASAVPGSQAVGQTVARPGDARSGRLSGRAGCNRYFASWRLSAEGLRIGPAAGTRMACNPALDAQEARFLALLVAVRQHEVGADGALRLLGDNGRLLLLARRE